MFPVVRRPHDGLWVVPRGITWGCHVALTNWPPKSPNQSAMCHLLGGATSKSSHHADIIYAQSVADVDSLNVESPFDFDWVDQNFDRP
jgi:hypothetical protein